MTSRSMTLDEMRQHLNGAKDLLSADKKELMAIHPLPDGLGREEYSFAYIRAERYGMRVINRKLADIAWLPMQLDAQAEVMDKDRLEMKRWIKNDKGGAPDAEDFGNDFIHALARAGSLHGWDNDVTRKLAVRIGNLFRDLSCLIGLVYYCSWMEDHGVTRFPIDADGDLAQMAGDMAHLLQSAQISDELRERERKIEKVQRRALAKPQKKKRPLLRLIENHQYSAPFVPDPLPV